MPRPPPRFPRAHSLTNPVPPYPSIITFLASNLDLNTLDALSLTCRQFRHNLLPNRSLLIQQTLRCANETPLPPRHPTLPDASSSKAPATPARATSSPPAGGAPSPSAATAPPSPLLLAAAPAAPPTLHVLPRDAAAGADAALARSLHLPLERVPVRGMRDGAECGGYELPTDLDVENAVFDVPGGTGDRGRGGE